MRHYNYSNIPSLPDLRIIPDFIIDLRFTIVLCLYFVFNLLAKLNCYHIVTLNLFNLNRKPSAPSTNISH